MAGSLNRASLIGNVGKDPEIRITQSGNKVANFSIATSESWKDKTTGEKKEKTDWHNIVVWGNLADIVEKYVSKGDKLMVEGKLSTRKWQHADGSDRYSTEIVLQGFDSRLLMLSPKGSGGGERDQGGDESQGEGFGKGETKRQPATGQGRMADIIDDEIPF